MNADMYGQAEGLFKLILSKYQKNNSKSLKCIKRIIKKSLSWAWRDTKKIPYSFDELDILNDLIYDLFDLDIELFKWFCDMYEFDIFPTIIDDMDQEECEIKCLRGIKKEIGKFFNIKDFNELSELCIGGKKWLYIYIDFINYDINKKIKTEVFCNIRKRYMKKNYVSCMFEI
jgi:hypothetical protein